MYKTCLRVDRVRLGVGLFGAAGGALVGVLAGGRLEATLRKCDGPGWARSHFGKAVKGVTTTEEPGRGVGLPKPVLLLSKLPPGSKMDFSLCTISHCSSV